MRDGTTALPEMASDGSGRPVVLGWDVEHVERMELLVALGVGLGVQGDDGTSVVAYAGQLEPAPSRLGEA